jgi:heat shock protein HtpX
MEAGFKDKQSRPKGGMGMRIALFLGTNIAVIALFTVIASIFGVRGNSLGGLVLLSVVIGFGGAFISLAMSKWIAKRSTGAQVIETPGNDTERWLVDTVARLADDAGIGMPEVAIFPSEAPNAFATGAKRNDALVAVSVGLLRNMNRDEIEAVLAHEVSHVANGDMVTMTLIQGVLNTFVILLSRIIANVVTSAISRGRGSSRGLYFIVVIVLQIVLGILASIIVMWFSRRREFKADAGAADLSGAPKMVSALQALQRDSGPADLPDEVAAFGIRPSAGGGGLRRLLMSHPPLEERIAALQSS